MREDARQMLSQGDGIATLYTQIIPSARQELLGHSENSKELQVQDNITDSKYVAVTDVIGLMQAADKTLKEMSPHPRDACVSAIDARTVTALTVCLVRTSHPQQDHVSPKVTDAAREEGELGKKATKIADEITKAQATGKLTGEAYRDLIDKSPLPDLTKKAIRLAQRGGANIDSPQGKIAKTQTTPITCDVPCRDPQTLRVLVQTVNCEGNSFTAKVTGFGAHTAFWRTFIKPTLVIDAVDSATQHGMQIARMLQKDIELDVSISISILVGPGKTDICKATVLRMPQVKDLAIELIKRLNQQLCLDLRFGDQSE